MTAINRRLVTNAIGERLATITHATGYYGQVGRPLPGQALVQDGGTIPADPPTKSPDDLRVRPYFVFFPSPGTPGSEVDLADTHVDLQLNLQVTAAGGDVADVLALVDRIHDALFRWAPTVPGVVCGPLRYPFGWNPGPVRTDRDFVPARLYVPLQYQLIATT